MLHPHASGGVVLDGALPALERRAQAAQMGLLGGLSGRGDDGCGSEHGRLLSACPEESSAITLQMRSSRSSVRGVRFTFSGWDRRPSLVSAMILKSVSHGKGNFLTVDTLLSIVQT